MFSNFALNSVNAIFLYAVTPFMQYTVLFGITLVVFIIAVARQTIIAFLLSSLMWFANSFLIYAVADPASGLTMGSSGLFLGLGFIMLLFTIKAAADKLTELSGEKQRRIQEEIV